jgi:hypothetical protein
MAGHREPDQGGERGAAHHDAAGALRKSEQLPAPLDDLALDVDGAMVAPAAVRVHGRRDQLGEHAAGRPGAVHPAPKTRVRVAGRVGQDQLLHVKAGTLEALPLDRKRFVERLPARIGYRLPHRSLPDRAQVVNGVVEQPVGEGLEGLPVGRVERIFRSGLEPAQCHDRSLELQALAANSSGHSLSNDDEGLEPAGSRTAAGFHGRGARARRDAAAATGGAICTRHALR